jgi:hypothetical protein
MSSEVDRTSNVVCDIPLGGARSATGVGGEVASSTSSSTMVDHAMARKETSPLYQDCKVSTVTDEDITAYHVAGWLSRALVCTPTILNFPTIN